MSERRQKIDYKAIRVTAERFLNGDPCFAVWIGLHRLGTVTRSRGGFLGCGGRKPHKTLEDAVVWEAYRNVRHHIGEASKLSNAANQIRPNDFAGIE